MRIITGYTGSDHITSLDDMARNMGTFGPDSYVLNTGMGLQPTVAGNSLYIAGGDGVMQGVHFRVPQGTGDVVSLQPGAAGYNRIDLVVAEYSRDTDTGYESISWAVIQGTPSATEATEPSYTRGSIQTGDLTARGVFFKVTFTGESKKVSRVAPTLLPMGWRGSATISSAYSRVTVPANSSVEFTTFDFPGDGNDYIVSIQVSATANANQTGKLVLSSNVGSQAAPFCGTMQAECTLTYFHSHLMGERDTLTLRNETSAALTVSYAIHYMGG